MLREAKNIVTIEGILAETDIKLGSFTKNKGTANEKIVNSISGTITIKTEQEINGILTPLMIPVSVFSAELTNAGALNPAYASILSVKEDFKSIASCGTEEEADVIKINKGSISTNFFWKGDTLVEYPRVTASFFQKGDKSSYKPEAKFEAEFVVASKEYELDKQAKETGRYKIKGIMPIYGQKVIPAEFFVVNPKAIQIMSQYWNEGDTVFAAGKLLFSSTSITETQELDFGDPIVVTKTNKISEFIITSGSQAPLEGPLAYDRAEISNAVTQRRAFVEQRKQADNRKEKAKAAPADALNLGF